MKCLQVQVHLSTLIQLQYNNNEKKKEEVKKRANYTLNFNIIKEKVCRSQRSQAFESATTTERLKQVGGGYTVLIKTI